MELEWVIFILEGCHTSLAILQGADFFLMGEEGHSYCVWSHLCLSSLGNASIPISCDPWSLNNSLAQIYTVPVMPAAEEAASVRHPFTQCDSRSLSHSVTLIVSHTVWLSFTLTQGDSQSVHQQLVLLAFHSKDQPYFIKCYEKLLTVGGSAVILSKDNSLV